MNMDESMPENVNYIYIDNKEENISDFNFY